MQTAQSFWKSSQCLICIKKIQQAPKHAVVRTAGKVHTFKTMKSDKTHHQLHKNTCNKKLKMVIAEKKVKLLMLYKGRNVMTNYLLVNHYYRKINNYIMFRITINIICRL